MGVGGGGGGVVVVQVGRNSIANALELHLSCTDPLM